METEKDRGGICGVHVGLCGLRRRFHLLEKWETTILCGGFTKIRGTFLGVPYNNNFRVSGVSIWVPPFRGSTIRASCVVATTGIRSFVSLGAGRVRPS